MTPNICFYFRPPQEDARRSSKNVGGQTTHQPHASAMADKPVSLK